MTKTVVIVQARMGSSRLPGKVLMPLAGRSVLSQVLERCQSIAGVDAVCCATTLNPEDMAIVSESRRCGVSVFRGSESDVLDRYNRAAKDMSADVILRVTSDCPLIDPEICGAVISLLDETGADYACNNMPPQWPHGLDCEAFSADWLQRAASQAHRPSEREHVTPYIRNHPEAKKVMLSGPGGSLAAHRWTLDTQADYEFLQKLFARLPDDHSAWNWRTTLDIVEADPALAAMNAGQDRHEGLRKSLAADKSAGYASNGHDE